MTAVSCSVSSLFESWQFSLLASKTRAGKRTLLQVQSIVPACATATLAGCINNNASPCNKEKNSPFARLHAEMTVYCDWKPVPSEYARRSFYLSRPRPTRFSLWGPSRKLLDVIIMEYHVSRSRCTISMISRVHKTLGAISRAGPAHSGNPHFPPGICICRFFGAKTLICQVTSTLMGYEKAMLQQGRELYELWRRSVLAIRSVERGARNGFARDVHVGAACCAVKL